MSSGAFDPHEIQNVKHEKKNMLVAYLSNASLLSYVESIFKNTQREYHCRSIKTRKIFNNLQQFQRVEC